MIERGIARDSASLRSHSRREAGPRTNRRGAEEETRTRGSRIADTCSACSIRPHRCRAEEQWSRTVRGSVQKGAQLSRHAAEEDQHEHAHGCTLWAALEPRSPFIRFSLFPLLCWQMSSVRGHLS